MEAVAVADPVADPVAVAFDADAVPVHISVTSAGVPRPACSFGNRCGRKGCRSCDHYRTCRTTSNVIHNLDRKISRQGAVKLYRLTFTLKNGPDLPSLLTTLFDGFKLLRDRAYWKTRVTGGRFNLHVDHFPETGWHPHLDVLVEATSLQAKPIRELWRELTGSCVVNVQRVGDTDLDRTKLTLYQAKAAWKKLADPQLRALCMSAIGTRRKQGRFGSWQNTAKDRGRWESDAVLRQRQSEETAEDAPPVVVVVVVDPFADADTVSDMGTGTKTGTKSADETKAAPDAITGTPAVRGTHGPSEGGGRLRIVPVRLGAVWGDDDDSAAANVRHCGGRADGGGIGSDRGTGWGTITGNVGKARTPT